MRKDIFQHRHYRDFLLARVGPAGTRSGVKGAMAKALRCQPTYVSQVLGGRGDFSLEQGEILADFFGLTEEEKHFFLLLLERDRAGTKSLEAYFTKQIEKVLHQRLVLTARLGAQNELRGEDLSIYYSSWQFSAVHIALTIPALRTSKALSRAFRLPLKRIAEVLEFLQRVGLAKKVGDHFEPGSSSIRIGNKAHQILAHHANWRHKAIESLERESILDLHYSGVFSLSREDVLRLKDRMLEFIDETVKTVRASPEEVLYSFCLDFFDLKRVDD